MDEIKIRLLDIRQTDQASKIVYLDIRSFLNVSNQATCIINAVRSVLAFIFGYPDIMMAVRFGANIFTVALILSITIVLLVLGYVFRDSWRRRKRQQRLSTPRKPMSSDRRPEPIEVSCSSQPRTGRRELPGPLSMGGIPAILQQTPSVQMSDSCSTPKRQRGKTVRVEKCGQAEYSRHCD